MASVFIESVTVAMLSRKRRRGSCLQQMPGPGVDPRFKDFIREVDALADARPAGRKSSSGARSSESGSLWRLLASAESAPGAPPSQRRHHFREWEQRRLHWARMRGLTSDGEHSDDCSMSSSESDEPVDSCRLEDVPARVTREYGRMWETYCSSRAHTHVVFDEWWKTLLDWIAFWFSPDLSRRLNNDRAAQFRQLEVDLENAAKVYRANCDYLHSAGVVRKGRADDMCTLPIRVVETGPLDADLFRCVLWETMVQCRAYIRLADAVQTDITVSTAAITAMIFPQQGGQHVSIETATEVMLGCRLERARKPRTGCGVRARALTGSDEYAGLVDGCELSLRWRAAPDTLKELCRVTEGATVADAGAGRRTNVCAFADVLQGVLEALAADEVLGSAALRKRWPSLDLDARRFRGLRQLESSSVGRLLGETPPQFSPEVVAESRLTQCGPPPVPEHVVGLVDGDGQPVPLGPPQGVRIAKNAASAPWDLAVCPHANDRVSLHRLVPEELMVEGRAEHLGAAVLRHHMRTDLRRPDARRAVLAELLPQVIGWHYTPPDPAAYRRDVAPDALPHSPLASGVGSLSELAALANFSVAEALGGSLCGASAPGSDRPDRVCVWRVASTYERLMWMQWYHHAETGWLTREDGAVDLAPVFASDVTWAGAVAVSPERVQWLRYEFRAAGWGTVATFFEWLESNPQSDASCVPGVGPDSLWVRVAEPLEATTSLGVRLHCDQGLTLLRSGPEQPSSADAECAASRRTLSLAAMGWFARFVLERKLLELTHDSDDFPSIPDPGRFPQCDPDTLDLTDARAHRIALCALVDARRVVHKLAPNQVAEYWTALGLPGAPPARRGDIFGVSSSVRARTGRQYLVDRHGEGSQRFPFDQACMRRLHAEYPQLVQLEKCAAHSPKSFPCSILSAGAEFPILLGSPALRRLEPVIDGRLLFRFNRRDTPGMLPLEASVDSLAADILSGDPARAGGGSCVANPLLVYKRVFARGAFWCSRSTNKPSTGRVRQVVYNERTRTYTKYALLPGADGGAMRQHADHTSDYYAYPPPDSARDVLCYYEETPTAGPGAGLKALRLAMDADSRAKANGLFRPAACRPRGGSTRCRPAQEEEEIQSSTMAFYSAGSVAAAAAAWCPPTGGLLLDEKESVLVPASWLAAHDPARPHRIVPTDPPLALAGAAAESGCLCLSQIKGAIETAIAGGAMASAHAFWLVKLQLGAPNRVEAEARLQLGEASCVFNGRWALQYRALALKSANARVQAISAELDRAVGIHLSPGERARLRALPALDPRELVGDEWRGVLLPIMNAHLVRMAVAGETYDTLQDAYNTCEMLLRSSLDGYYKGPGDEASCYEAYNIVCAMFRLDPRQSQFRPPLELVRDQNGTPLLFVPGGRKPRVKYASRRKRRAIFVEQTEITESRAFTKILTYEHSVIDTASVERARAQSTRGAEYKNKDAV